MHMSLLQDRAYIHNRPDIIYPDKVTYRDGERLIDNRPSEVLRRGLRDAASLNHRVADEVPFAGPNTIIYARITQNSLATRLGLPHYTEDKQVYDAAVSLARSIEAEVVDTDEVRTRVGLLGYVAISESQAFLSANKRTGRIIYGRLQYGPESEGIKKGIDTILEAELPPDLETLILLQNTVRCMNGTELSVDEYGGVYIEEDVKTRFYNQRALLDKMRIFSADGDKGFVKQFHETISTLEKVFGALLQDKTLAQKTASIMMQEDYGPAVWLLCCEGAHLQDITPEIAERIIATNTKLLQMRIFSILNAVANGGKFVSITDVTTDDRSRVHTISHWLPYESMQDMLPLVP